MQEERQNRKTVWERTGTSDLPPGKTAFIFSGLGAQWKTMGSGLLDEEIFHRKLAECDRAFGRYAGRSIMADIAKNADCSLMEDSEIAQRCTFAIQVALAELLSDRGIKPDAVAGHSVGEIAAAHTAGILTIEDAAEILWQHSILMKKLKGRGRLLFAALPAKDIEDLIKNERELSVAAVNGPESVVVSGAERISDLKKTLEDRDVFTRILKLEYCVIPRTS